MKAEISRHACMLHAQLFNLYTETMKLAEETSVITVFVCELLLSTRAVPYFSRRNGTERSAIVPFRSGF